MKNELLKAILDTSGDEFETENDIENLKNESVEELTERIISIAYWYHSMYNDSKD